MPNIEKTDSKGTFSCLKWTYVNRRREACVNLKTDTQSQCCRVPLRK